MTRRILLAAACLPLATLAIAAPAHDYAPHRHSTKAIAISDGWARETAPGQVNGGGFLTITNASYQPDRLIGAASPNAAAVQLHTMTMDGGIMRMRQLVDGIPIPANGSVELKPGGMHIMFMGVRAPFRPGGQIKLSLRFAKAGRVDVTLPVRPVGAMGGMDMNHDHH